MNLTFEEIAAHTGGRFEGAGAKKVRGYSIDSRSIRPGELFIAIKGPRFDGHRFLDEVANKGASGALISEEVGGLNGFSMVRVGSTLEALHDLARSIRRQWGGPVIGITGSVGKTTTREMVAAVLGVRHRVLSSTGNLNNEYGLPLCLLRLEPHHDVAVMEMGMSAAGEIGKLATIAEPNEGLITNVNPVHLEFFNSVDGIAAAKAELLEGLVGHRRAYLNNDDTRVRRMSRRFDGDIVTYGIRSAASFRVTSIESLGVEGTAFTTRHRRREVRFTMPLLGVHNVINAAAAISVGVTRGLDWDGIVGAFEGMAPGRMRGNVVRFDDGFSLIDDSYNSNPRALTEMIRLLVSVPGFERRILVAGDMLELGAESAKLHAGCGRDAVKAGVDMIVGVGPHAEALIAGARDAGAGPSRLKLARDAGEAGELLVGAARSGDLILVKGSRGMKLEKTIDTLRLSFSVTEP